MLYPARGKLKIIVDQSKVLKNRLYRLFRFFGPPGIAHATETWHWPKAARQNPLASFTTTPPPPSPAIWLHYHYVYMRLKLCHGETYSFSVLMQQIVALKKGGNPASAIAPTQIPQCWGVFNTERKKKLITSSGRRPLKSTLSKLIIFGHK